MAVKQFICTGRDPRGDKFKFMDKETCLKCSESGLHTCHLSAPYIRAVIDAVEKKRDPLSASVLSGCPRKTCLNQVLHYRINPAHQVMALRGNLFHSVLAGFGGNKDYVETRFYRDYQGYRISGQPDIIYGKRRISLKSVSEFGLGVERQVKKWCEGEEYPIRLSSTGKTVMVSNFLDDYKTTNEIPQWRYPYRHHTNQVNTYKWILEGKECCPERLFVVYQDMRNTKRTEALIHTTEEVEKHLDEGLQPLIVFFDKWNAYVGKGGKKNVYESVEFLIENLPPKFEAGHWMCQKQYCPFVTQCFALHDMEFVVSEFFAGLEGMAEGIITTRFLNLYDYIGFDYEGVTYETTS